jgi:hypothetical protein
MPYVSPSVMTEMDLGYIQSSIFFSSGQAQMKGGGDLCIFIYSCTSLLVLRD